MAMFAVNSASSVFQHGQQTSAARARNRAKLQNFNADNEAYIANTILENTSWKDRVLQSEVAIDDIFQNSADQWRQQDMQMEEVYNKHAYDTIDILKSRYKNEYAGEQTGVTAGRLAGAPVREAGMALTKSVRNVVMNENKTQLNKEIITNQANQKTAQQWEQVRQAPVPGHTPPPPQYEAGPGVGGLLMQIAVSAAGAYMQGTQINKMNKIMEGGQKGITGNFPSLSGTDYSKYSSPFAQGVNPFDSQNLANFGGANIWDSSLGSISGVSNRSLLNVGTGINNNWFYNDVLGSGLNAQLWRNI